MKRTLSFTLALLMIIPMIIGALPQFSFADAVEITDNSGYSGGIRKKSDGSILFSPNMTPVKDAVAAGASLSDYTVKMTFTLLTGKNGNEVCTFDTVHAALNKSNGSYYDIYLNGAKGNSGFCPEAGKYYNIYVEVVTGFGTDAEAVAFYGTYTSMQAASAISSSSYYAPTAVPEPEPEPEPEPTPATEISTYALYGTGIRKSSKGYLIFSPYLNPVSDEMVAGAAYTIKATFTLLDAEGNDEYTFPQFTFDTVDFNSTGTYFANLYMIKGDYNCGFCPEAGRTYDIDIEVYDGSTLKYFGNFEDITAPDTIKDATNYAPTPIPGTDPEPEPEPDPEPDTPTATEIENYTVYKNGIRKTSGGYISFSPYLTPVAEKIVAGANYTIKATFTLLSGKEGDDVCTFPQVTFDVFDTYSTTFVNLYLTKGDYKNSFCPEAGKYYDIDVEVYDGETLVYYGNFEDVVALDDISAGNNYAPTPIPGTEPEPEPDPEPDTPTGTQITETTEGYTGSVTYNGIRKNSGGKILFSPFISQLRAEAVDGGKGYGAFTIKATFHLLDADKKVIASFPATMQPQSSNGYYVDIPFAGCGFCPTAGAYYDIEVEIYEGTTIKYYGTYKNIQASTAIAESSEYSPTAIPGKPVEFDISLSYSFNNALAGSAAGNIYFTVDKAGYFEVRWADAEGKPLTAVIGSKTLPYAPLAKIAIAADGGSHMEKMIGFTAIPQGAAKLIVTDSALNVLKTIDIPANKQLAAEDYTLSFGTISDLHYNYFWLDSEKTQDAAVGAVDRALAFYEALGVDLITAAGDYSLYNEENSYQKYQAAVSKINTNVLACAGNHEVYTWNGDKMYAPGGYWLTYMNNDFYNGQIEGVLDIADNGVDLAYSIPGAEDYVFISLNQWYYDGHTPAQESLLKDEQLEWLAEMFETYKDKTVYLLFHTYLGDDDFETIDGQGDMTNPGGYTYGSFYNQYTDEEAVLRSLLEKYDNVVWYNGHSHYEYAIQKYNENLNIFDYYGTSATMVHVPSVTNMRTVSDSSTGYSSMYHSGASQGALTLAYDGYQIINGVDIQNEEILSYATYIVYDDKTVSEEIEGTDITWTYDEQLNSLRFDGTGAMPDYTAASEAPFAEYMNSVKTVYVANGITAVGANTFNGYAALSTVSLKNSVTTIGENAFAGTSITSLTLPKALTTIGNGAFAGITSSITVTYYGAGSEWNALNVGENNEALTGATVKYRSFAITFDVNGNKTVVNVAVNKVPSYDGDRPVKEHEDPNKYYTFVGWTDGTNTYAPGAELPKATKDVTYTALFVESADERVATGFIGTITWRLDKVTGILTISGSGATPKWTDATKSEWHAYADLITEVIVEAGVTEIGAYAFSKLNNLTKVTLPEGLTTLNADAFSYNKNLKTLVLPSTLKTIGQGVTYQTDNITTVYYGCGAEAWAIFTAGITAPYNDVLKNATPIFAHEGALEYTSTEDQHTHFCASCSFSITANHSFSEAVPGTTPGTLEKTCGTCGYVKIENLIVTGVVGTTIWSLDQTTGILTISGVGAMPNWDNDTKGEWHKYADLITKVIVEEGVTTVGNFTFSGLKNLTEVVLPEGVTAINADAFSYNPALTTLHLPSTLDFIGQGILWSSNNVSTIYYSGCAHQWATLVEGIQTLYNDAVKNASPIFAKTGTTCIFIDDETHSHVCEHCDAIIVTEEHTEGEIFEVEATTESAGGKFYICPVCGGTVTVEVYEQITAIGGDINKDGTVTISDVTLLLDYIAVSDDLKAEMAASGLILVEGLDCNGDNQITIGDVTRLLDVLAGIPGAEAVLKPVA